MLNIIKNTIIEFMRLKVLYIWIFIAIILIFSSYILDTLTINQWNKAIIDFSLTIIEVFALILTLFLWAYLLYNEFSKKTVLLILSKIKHKYYFIIWKFLWFSIIIFFVYFILSLGFLWALILHNIPVEIYYFQAILLSYVKILVVLSFLIFFSTLVSPFLSLLSSLFIYFVSHASAFMLFFTKMRKSNEDINPFMEYIMQFIYYILPNFHDLSMKEYFLSPYLSNYTDTHFMLSLIAWAFVYIFVLLVLSSIIFRKKEF